jgi:hypothetical protein
MLEIDVNATGYFVLREKGVDGPLGRADTLEKAITQAKAKLAKAKVRVHVPFYDLNGESGVATGIHGGHGGVTAKVGGTPVVLSTGRTRVIRADIPVDKLKRLMELRQQIWDAQREVGNIEAEFAFDVRKAVEAAIAEAEG